MRGFRVIASTLLLLLISCGAEALDGEFSFPKRIDTFERGNRRDYEYQERGLGYSFAYHGENWTVTVYVYNMRHPTIPDGPSSSLVREQIDQASEDISRSVQQGTYGASNEIGSFRIALKNAQPIDCRAFTIVSMNSDWRESVLCVTAMRNNFIKFRLSGPRGRVSRTAAEDFIAHWLAAQ